MWHILLFSSETEISENQVLRLSDWTACVYVCGQCKTHRLRTRLLMCFQLGTDVSLVQSVERRAAPGEHQPGESVFTPAGAAHGHEPQPHHQKTLLEGNMQLSSSKCMHCSYKNETFPHRIPLFCSSVTRPLSFPGENAVWKLSVRPGGSSHSRQTSVRLWTHAYNPADRKCSHSFHWCFWRVIEMLGENILNVMFMERSYNFNVERKHSEINIFRTFLWCYLNLRIIQTFL